MRGSAFGGLLAVIMAFGAVGAQQAHPPVEAFGQLPGMARPTISPDGRHVAVINPYQGRPALLIYDLDNDAADPTVLSFTSSFLVDAVWKTDRRLLVTINKNVKQFGPGVEAYYRLAAMDLDGQKPVLLLGKLPSVNYNMSVSRIADLATDDPDHVYMPFWEMQYDGDFRHNLLKVDVNTGGSELYVRGTAITEDYLMDGHGAVVAKLEEDTSPLVDHLYLYRHESWQEVEKADASGGRGIALSGLSEDGKSLVREVTRDAGQTGLITVDLGDQSMKPLFFDDKYDIGSPLRDPWSDRIIGASVVADAARDLYFSPGMQALQRGLENAFPGKEVHAETWDRAQQRVIVRVESPRFPAAYFLLDRKTHVAQRLGRTYPSLNEADLGEMKPYPYKARDGLDIPAYLTLPPGKAAQNLPTVIMPHGGPMARDQIGFDWMAQFFANRGYAVLQPNFRGSSGYGTAFEEAGYGQWGLKMQDDITDGVQKLIADGIADPKRICIVGGSYGGYAALAGAAFTPDLYACAVSWAGVTDLRRFLKTRARDYGHDSWMISSWSRYIGDRWDDSEKLDAASPAMNAAKIKCPVLLLHGTADTTVRIDQSEVMEDALKRAGKSVRFVAVKDETHYMMTAETRILFLREVEAFLAAHIGT